MARILLIEDDDEVRNALRMTLAHFGHAVVDAADGKRGLENYHVGEFDLVITDIVMPEKEGMEVLMEIRKKTPHAKTIAISGGGRTGSSDYLQVAKLMGATRTLAKPFSSDELMAAVDDVLRRRD